MIGDSPAFAGHQRVSFHHDPATGLRAVVALHRLRHGRGCGGIRFRAYAGEAEAAADVMRLSEAMTYKSVLAGLPVGGGKSVIIASPGALPEDDLMRAMGDVVQSYDGAYVCAPDVGIGTRQLEILSERTEHVVGIRHESAPFTARGVLRAIDAVAGWTFRQDDLRGLRIAVQGVGNVGAELVRMLVAGGADVSICDVDEQRVDDLASETDASRIRNEEFHGFRGDILVPAAMGGSLDAGTIPGLRVKAVVGPANNQLASRADGAALRARGIDFVPDFVASAGGVIAGVHELGEFRLDEVHEHIDRIKATSLGVLETARERGLDETSAALAIARERLENEAEAAADAGTHHHDARSRA